MQALQTLFLVMPTFTVFIVNLIIIGLLPAIAEEFLFRGALQQLLYEGFKNIHVAIWVTAIIFSAIHVQFYGFVPRMILGAILGYLFYWSGNIWVPIIGHLFNNGGQVALTYLHQQGVIKYDIDTDETVPIYLALVSALLLAGCLYIAWKNRVPEPVVVMDEHDMTDNQNNTPTWP